jgi:hypothetical protein
MYPRLTAQRLFKEVRSAGDSGGYTQLKEYVRQIRPPPTEDAVQRFETPAGFRARWALRLLISAGAVQFIRRCAGHNAVAGTGVVLCSPRRR